MRLLKFIMSSEVLTGRQPFLKTQKEKCTSKKKRYQYRFLEMI